jgi:hypothetical protein
VPEFGSNRLRCVSRSCAAVIQVGDPEGVALIYQYQNQPLAAPRKPCTCTRAQRCCASPATAPCQRLLCGTRHRRTFGRIYCRRQVGSLHVMSADKDSPRAASRSTSQQRPAPSASERAVVVSRQNQEQRRPLAEVGKRRRDL